LKIGRMSASKESISSDLADSFTLGSLAKNAVSINMTLQAFMLLRIFIQKGMREYY